MIWIALTVICYFVVGGVVDSFVESDGMMVFFWLPVLALICIAAPLYGAYWVGKKAIALPKYLVERNKPPSPSDIVRGVIATVVLRHLEGWTFDRSARYNHKNISIVRGANEIGNGSWIVKVSGENLATDEKLIKAIDESRKIARAKHDHQIKYEKDLRMLEGLQEFIDTPPSALQFYDEKIKLESV